MNRIRDDIAGLSIPFYLVAVGLACLFAGIWTSDDAALVLLEPPGGELAMRISSLIVYGGLFLGVQASLRHAQRQSTSLNPRRLLQRATVVALLAFVAGSILMLLTSTLALSSTAHTLTAAIALFLLKGIGAPLSVVLVCRCAKLPYRLLARVSALGIVGAFALKEGLGYFAEFVQLGIVGQFIVGSILILAAACLAAPGLLGDSHVDDESRQESAAGLQPLSALINRNLAAGLVVAAMMLGFLRAITPQGPVDLPSAVVIALTLIIIVVLFASNLGIHELFRGALVCTAGGFLLGPVLQPFVADGGNMLISIGTVLFEAVVWFVAAIIVRSCTQPLLAAAAVRLVIVLGHLVGAALGVGAEAWSHVEPNATEALSLVIVFAYVIMLVYLFNDPVAKLPFTTGRPSTSTPKYDSPTSTQPVSSDALQWSERCAVVAREHNLTPRETDVLELLARGRDLAFMEEKFVLSRNTVKMHIRHVYEKLGVHSKQEVINLMEAQHSEVPPTRQDL